jgi:hypothetical protein
MINIRIYVVSIGFEKSHIISLETDENADLERQLSVLFTTLGTTSSPTHMVNNTALPHPLRVLFLNKETSWNCNEISRGLQITK